jgi:hypothetical protein
VLCQCILVALQLLHVLVRLPGPLGLRDPDASSLDALLATTPAPAVESKDPEHSDAAAARGAQSAGITYEQVRGAGRWNAPAVCMNHLTLQRPAEMITIPRPLGCCRRVLPLAWCSGWTCHLTAGAGWASMQSPMNWSAH